jgi:hypothetical protein
MIMFISPVREMDSNHDCRELVDQAVCIEVKSMGEIISGFVG